MSELYTSKRIIAMALAVGLGATGCSDAEQNSEPVKINCAAQEPEQWQRMPSNFNAPGIATRLGVSEADVRNGLYGKALCDQAVSPQEISGGVSLLTVQDIGRACMAIGLQLPPTEPRKEVIAVCAAGPVNT